MKDLKDLLDAKSPSSAWADAGVGAGIASLLGLASYHAFRGHAPAYQDQKGKDMTSLETALLNLVPLLIEATRSLEKDRDHARVELKRESTRADTLNDRLGEAREKFVELEEAIHKTVASKDETIAALRTELQNLQRLYPANVVRPRQPGTPRSKKKMT